MGLFFKKTKPDEDLAQGGVRGHATVLHVDMPRMGMSMSMSGGKAEEMLRGDVTPIRRKVRLRVEVPGREAYEVGTKLNVPVMLSGRLVAGSGLTVMVDPKDPQHLAVDWSAGIQAGSPTAMIDDNPMVSAALQGMGIDPAQLAQRMEQAQAMSAAWQAQMAQQGQPVVLPPGMMPSGMPTPGQAPPGWPQGVAWPTPQAPGAVPPAAWPQQPTQEWPGSTSNEVGPTSEDKPEE